MRPREAATALLERATYGALLWLVATIAAGQAAGQDRMAEGRELYLSGQRADGSKLAATVQQDVSLPAASSACANCHRRSGLGTSEGSIRSLPITGPALFRAATVGHGRPAYDAASLRRAIAEGIAADGRGLNALMPRYQLEDRDAESLVAYLQTLGSQPPPGVANDEIDLATIVSDDVPQATRDALVKVLERYVQIKNSGTRRESERAAAARRHPFGERRDRAFRRWHLSVWNLSGAPQTWERQLRRYYAKRPPFAVLSGIASHDWAVVHQFCEQQQMPCILPVTDIPGDATTGFYSLYYSMGAALEARVTARHIANTLDGDRGRVMLLYSDAPNSIAAHTALRDVWDEHTMPTLIEHAVPQGRVPTYREWQELIGRERPDVLIAWLEPSQLQALAASSASTQLMPRRIYTAQSLSPWNSVAALGAIRARVWHVYPYQVPVPGRSQFPREQAWLQAQHLESLDLEVAARALFACHALGEGLMSLDGNFSREYLLEQLEHMLDGTAMTSLFPGTRLGPGQRVLSHGAFVTRLGGPNGAAPFDAQWLPL